MESQRSDIRYGIFDWAYSNHSIRCSFNSFWRVTDEVPPFYDSIEEYLRGKRKVKKWYKSKVLWFNVIAIAGVLIHLYASSAIQSQWIALEGGLIAIINIILRSITNQGLQK